MFYVRSGRLSFSPVNGLRQGQVWSSQEGLDSPRGLWETQTGQNEGKEEVLPVQPPGSLQGLAAFPWATGRLWVHWGLEGPQQEMAQQMFFPSSVLNVLKAQRNFQWLRVGVLGVIRLTKYKTDFGSCSHRACESAGPGTPVGQRPPSGLCGVSEEHLWETGPWGSHSLEGPISEKSQHCSHGQVTLLLWTPTFPSRKWERSCH